MTIAPALALDDLMPVSELSPEALRLVASRVEASHSPEQIVYRETELDEVWRLADLALAGAGAKGDARRRSEIERLATVAELVHAAHDLIGQKEDTNAAAIALRQAAVVVAGLRNGD